MASPYSNYSTMQCLLTSLLQLRSVPFFDTLRCGPKYREPPDSTSTDPTPPYRCCQISWPSLHKQELAGRKTRPKARSSQLQDSGNYYYEAPHSKNIRGLQFRYVLDQYHNVPIVSQHASGSCGATYVRAERTWRPVGVPGNHKQTRQRTTLSHSLVDNGAAVESHSRPEAPSRGVDSFGSVNGVGNLGNASSWVGQGGKSVFQQTKTKCR
jgi:hypothetical protein